MIKLKSSNTRYIAGSIFILGVLLLSSEAAYAQSPPSGVERLAKKMIQYINAKDKDGLKSLIHPRVIAYMDKNDPGSYDEIITAWVGESIPTAHEIAYKPVSSIKEYDAEKQTFDLYGRLLYFPTPPTHFLVIVSEQEATVTVEGKEEKRAVKAPLRIDALREEGGKWYLVLPEKWKKNSTG